MSKQTRLNFSRSATAAPAKKRRRLSTSEDENGERNEASNKAEASTITGKRSGSVTARQTNIKAHKKANTASNAKETHEQPKSMTKHPKPRPNSTSAVNSKPAVKDSQNPTTHLKVTSSRTSLFASPPNTVLCHATNAQGTWGAGIAAAFKTHYPKAFTVYAAHCKKWPSSTLLGTTLLIPPQTSSSSKSEREAKNWIGCLFTSEKKGKGKGSKESILQATADAVEDLARKVGAEGDIAGVRMCKINSGLFGVEWEASKAVIEGVEVEVEVDDEAEGSVVREIMVCSLD